MTVNLILERTFGDALTPADVIDAGRESKWCLEQYRVQWHGSFLSTDGHTMICRFSAPDLESARSALRDPDVDLSRFWAGTLYSSPTTAAPNVVVVRTFDAPVQFEDIASIGRNKSWCFETHRVKHTMSVHSLDGKRMLCFYGAPDAEAVRKAQREAAMPVESVWACAPIVPAAG